MAKPKRENLATPPAGDDNAKSSVSSPAARPWTAEEMAAAVPLPIPGGGPRLPPAADLPLTGAPHAGRGQVLPAGAPEKEGGGAS